MILFDSDILIYAPLQREVREFVADQSEAAVSLISLVEVLGYSNLDPSSKIFFENLFDRMIVLQISEDIIEKAIQLRQKRKMSLGDSIIAGTALINRTTLVTNNEKDFSWIEGLTIINPLKK